MGMAVLSRLMRLALLSFAIVLAPLTLAETGSETLPDRRQFNRCRTAGDTLQEQITAYRAFIEDHPTSEYVDDAYLEIAERQRKLGEIAEARETLRHIVEKFQDALKVRYIYVGDIQERWLKDWESYIGRNPIRTADFANLKLAELDVLEGKYESARTILKDLIERTKRPDLVDRTNPAILTADDIRKDILALSLAVATKLGDMAWHDKVRSILSEEYEGIPFPLTLPVSSKSLEKDNIRPNAYEQIEDCQSEVEKNEEEQCRNCESGPAAYYNREPREECAATVETEAAADKFEGSAVFTEGRGEENRECGRLTEWLVGCAIFLAAGCVIVWSLVKRRRERFGDG